MVAAFCVAHVRLQATKHVAGILLHNTSSTLDMGSKSLRFLEAKECEASKPSRLPQQPYNSTLRGSTHALESRMHHRPWTTRTSSFATIVSDSVSRTNSENPQRSPAMSANDVRTKHSEELVNALMGVAHHDEKIMVTVQNFPTPTSWLQKEAAY